MNMMQTRRSILLTYLSTLHWVTCQTILTLAQKKKQKTLIQNFHIKYECLDSRDDYRAQLAKGGPGFVSSWDNEDGDSDTFEPITIPEGTEFDSANVPYFLQEGTAYRRRKEQRLTMRRILASVGWTKEHKESKSTITESIKTMRTRSAAE